MNQKMRRKLAGALLAALGGICWGLSGSMGQYLFSRQGMDSRWLVPIRLFTAGVILLIYCTFRYGKRTLAPWHNKRDAIGTLLYCIPGVALSQFLYFLCIQKSSAGIGTILQALSPVTVLITTCLIARKLPKRMEVLSIILALSGVFCLVTHGRITDLAVSWSAIAAGVGSALCITLYNMLGEPLLKKYPVTVLQSWSFLLGGAFFALIFRPWSYRYTPNAIGIFGIAFVVIVGNVLAFTTYMTGVHLVGPMHAILYEFSEPVTAAVVTTLFLGSPFTWWDALGMVLIFFMVVSISWRPKNA